MAGGVHGGSLGRWFEELCRIKFERLREIVASNRARVAKNKLPSQGGVYVFWWTGSRDQFKSPDCQRWRILHGPGGRDVELKIDDEWLGLETNLPIPLYVGKSANQYRDSRRTTFAPGHPIACTERTPETRTRPDD